jgi:hypothetical protein
VLFLVAPDWERVWLLREAEPEMIQIVPILTEGSGGAAGHLAMAAVPEDRGDFRIEEGTSRTEAEIRAIEDSWADILWALGPPAPQVITPVPAIPGGEGRGNNLRVEGLNLDQLSALTPRVTDRNEALAWPLIRNPSVVDRALRAKVAAGRLLFEPRKLVSVALGINERGGVDWAEVFESSGQTQVDEVAVSLFNEVVMFAPARHRGSPVPVSIIISILF